MKSSVILVVLITLTISGLLYSQLSLAESSATQNTTQDADNNSDKKTLKKAAEDLATSTLIKLERSIEDSQKSIKVQKKALKSELTPGERLELENKLDQQRKQLNTLNREFESLATRVDISALKSNQSKQQQDLSDELVALIEPLLKEARRATEGMRQKAYLQEQLDDYKTQLSTAERALKNLENTQIRTTPKDVKKHLSRLIEHWSNRVNRLESQLAASQQQVELLEQDHPSMVSTIRSGMRDFVQTRGLYLFAGISAFIVTVAIMRLVYRMVLMLFPAFKKNHRSFRIRSLQLTFFVFSAAIAGLSPALVFYLVEDWLLFSLTLLVLFGLFWSTRMALTQLWKQALMFLNIGSVREGERVFYDGLPWLVRNINLYTKLINPISGVEIRLPIVNLLDLTSRPTRDEEPWFPCQNGDWLLFDDGYFGQVMMISYEMIDLIDLSGSIKNIQLKALVAAAPVNISEGTYITNYLHLGLSHRQDITQAIPFQLQMYLEQRMQKEDVCEQLKGIYVEFNGINGSALELIIFADLKGHYANQYKALKRRIEAWIIDACNQYDWITPLPQIKVFHTESNELSQS